MILLIKMMKKFILILPLVALFLVFQTKPVNGTSESETKPVQIDKFPNVDKISTKINQDQLPSPYNHLLTQPLMTKTLETYYARTAIVKAVFAKLDQANNIYHRSIIMLVDSNKGRNNVLLAQTKKEAMIVEFASISINFNELPKNIIDAVLHSDTPFGKLLTENHLNVLTKDRGYFTVTCNKALASFMHCNLNDLLYGRRNTIIRADNKKWLAHVVEILPRTPRIS